MASKVLVNIPTEHFKQQVHKIDPITQPPINGYSIAISDPTRRIHQLEQNIKFLQEQHQLMLSGLHKEIEHLQRWNRDLQFKLIFSKNGVALLESSPSSPEDDHTQHKILLSPNQVNITPLQVEILERDITELKTNLSESRTRNVYLQNIIDEQKNKVTMLEQQATVFKNSNHGKENVGKGKQLVSTQESMEELEDKLEDAERLIRRLRRENEEQRKEILSLRNSKQIQLEGKREGHRGHYRNQQQSYHTRFPPLQANNHYNHGGRPIDFRNPEMADSLDHESQVIGKPAPMLPHLRERNHATTSTGYASNPTYNNYQGNYRRYYHRKQQDGGGGRSTRGGNHRTHTE